MILIGTDRGTTTTIIRIMLSEVAAIIIVVRPSVLVPSVVTVRPTAVIAEVLRHKAAIARASCVTEPSTVVVVMAGPTAPIRVPILITRVIVTTAVIVTPEAIATLAATRVALAVRAVPVVPAVVAVLTAAVVAEWAEEGNMSSL